MGHIITPPIQLLIYDRVFVGLIFYSSSLVLIFRDFPYCQIFKDRIDPTWRNVDGHDVVDEFFGVRTTRRAIYEWFK